MLLSSEWRVGRGRSRPDTEASSGAAVFLQASGGHWRRAIAVNSVLPECVEGAYRMHSKQNMVNDEEVEIVQTWLAAQPLG